MTENNAATEPAVDITDGTDQEPAQTTDEEPETFDREYVQKLRDEAAGHRVKAKAADALRGALVTSYAAATGNLADATDLPYTDDLLDDDGMVDMQKVTAAVKELLARKPHLTARRPTGSIGQGARPESEAVGLASLLRRGA